ncbi:hypothetical protein [Ligilactobacillus acidipiscis]|nr:hypothetical protein [Ligilactobacillus acidipiscis]
MENLIRDLQTFIQGNFKDSRLIDQILENYKGLNKKQQTELEPKMYFIYRGKFDLLFSSSQYTKSVPWMDKVVNHKGFSQELLDNKNHFFVEAVKSLLIVYLETNNPDLFHRAKRYFNLIRESYLKEVSLIDLYKQDTAIFKALDNADLYTETDFKVPISIKTIKETVHISLPQNNIEADVTCVSLPIESNNNLNSSGLVRDQDRDSTIKVSHWSVKINKYLSCEQSNSTDDSFSIMQEVVCQIVNKVIDKYRVKTHEYWVKKIYPTMIQGHSIKYKAGNLIFRDILFYDRSQFTISAKQPQVSLRNVDGSFIQDPPLYKKLFLDAQTYLLTQNLGTSILLLNMAFENFTYTVVCPIIINQSAGKYTEAFYLKPIPYTDYFLNDYLTKNQYQDAVSKEIIKPRGMSQYAIYNILYKISESFQQKTTKTKLKKLISSIRKHRNEIVHGSFDVRTLKYNDVQKQLASFEKLISFI